MGVVPPEPGFLEALRRLCDASGALLVFDEVITGFRVARGGAQERFGVPPDLTILGKIVGGGLPLAAFGGRAEVMERLAPAGDVYQAGTLSGNPLATAAGLSVLRRLRDPAVYARARGAGRAAGGRAGAVRSCAARRRDAHALHDRQRPSAASRTRRRCDPDRYGALFRHLLERGIYIPPSQFESCSSRSRTATRRSTGRSRPLPTSSPTDGCGRDRRRGGPPRARSGTRRSAPSERERSSRARPRRFALGIETIYEGYLLHYGRPRLFAPPDGERALLLGDYLYAHGLVRIAATVTSTRSPTSPS